MREEYNSVLLTPIEADNIGRFDRYRYIGRFDRYRYIGRSLQRTMGQLGQKDAESINSLINSPEITEENFNLKVDGCCKNILRKFEGSIIYFFSSTLYTKVKH